MSAGNMQLTASSVVTHHWTTSASTMHQRDSLGLCRLHETKPERLVPLLPLSDILPQPGSDEVVALRPGDTTSSTSSPRRSSRSAGTSSSEEPPQQLPGSSTCEMRAVGIRSAGVPLYLHSQTCNRHMALSHTLQQVG